MDKNSLRFVLQSSELSSSYSSNSLTESLLSRLHRPTLSELSRKRKIDENPPRGKRRSCGLAGASDSKSVTPQQWVAEFSNLKLTVSNKKLFCSACREELSVKCSVVRMNIQSAKHKTSKEGLLKNKKTEKDIADALQVSNHMVNSKEETLPEDQRVYCIKVVQTFLRCGAPLNKIPEFREFLEENALRLTDRRHMSDMVPFILEQEKIKIQEEIAQKPLAIIFDGTSRLGEALCMVVRFIDSEWSIQERLIRFELLAKSLSGEEIARQLICVLSVQLSEYPIRILGGSNA